MNKPRKGTHLPTKMEQQNPNLRLCPLSGLHDPFPEYIHVSRVHTHACKHSTDGTSQQNLRWQGHNVSSLVSAVKWWGWGKATSLNSPCPTFQTWTSRRVTLHIYAAKQYHVVKTDASANRSGLFPVAVLSSMYWAWASNYNTRKRKQTNQRAHTL